MVGLVGLNTAPPGQLPQLPSMQGGFQPLFQSPLAGHMAMGGNFQGNPVSPIEMPQQDAAANLDALSQAGANQPRPQRPAALSGVAPSSSTPPAPTATSGAPQGQAGAPMSWSQALQHLAALGNQIRGGMGGVANLPGQAVGDGMSWLHGLLGGGPAAPNIQMPQPQGLLPQGAGDPPVTIGLQNPF